jgi:hypothetical protein
MAQQGDVARRMNLYSQREAPLRRYNNVHSPEFRRHVDIGYFPYHGVVSVSFGVGSIHGYYAGPGFYPQYVYYPHWSPWVSWSWATSRILTGTRGPIWCRPVYYEPAPLWVYEPTPVWVAMPVVSCGTWVDVPPVAVPPWRYDLQLLAVRFVDPGHPEERLGPRYRVWYRNNSSQPVTQGFNVVALASNDPLLRPGLPQAGVRVRAIAPGDTQSVDIRLPAEVNAMGRAPDASPIPFSNLTVLVDVPLLLFSPSPSSPPLLFCPSFSPSPFGSCVPNVSRRGEFLPQGIPFFSPAGIVAIPRMASRRPHSSADLFAGQPVRPTEPFDECSSRRNKVAPSSRHGSCLTDSSWQKVFSPRRFLAGSPFFQAIRGKKSFFPGDSWRDVRFPGRFLVTVHEEPAKAAGPLPVPSAAASAIHSFSSRRGRQPLAGGCGAPATPPPVARPAHAKRPRRGRDPTKVTRQG